MHWDTLKWVYEVEHPEAVKNAAFAVLTALAYSMNPRNMRCNPSINRLCRLTRLKSTAVKTALSILKKNGLITLSSGKRLKKSNSYVINYRVVPKKKRTTSDIFDEKTLTPTTESTNIVPTIDEKSTNTELNKVENPATNIVMNDAFTCVVLPQSIHHTGVRQESTTTHSDSAAVIALEWATKENWTTDKNTPYTVETIKNTYLYDVLAFLPKPTIDDAKKICNIVNNSRDYDAWEKIIELIDDIDIRKSETPPIYNLRSYFYASLKNLFDNSPED